MRLGTSMLSLWPVVFERDSFGRVVCKRHLLEAHIAGLPARGVEHFEFTWDPADTMEALFDEDWKALLRRCQSEMGLTFSVHLPQYGLDVAALHQEVADFSIVETVRAIECTQDLGMTHYVLHAGITCGRLQPQLSSLSPLCLESMWETTVAVAKNTLPSLFDVAEPRTIAVENIPYATLAPLASLIEDLDLGVCFDVGHAVRAGEAPLDFFDRFRERISAIHFHDVKSPSSGPLRGGVPDHQLLGSGHVGYEHLLDAFVRAGFDGPLVIELQALEDEEPSTSLVRAYLSGQQLSTDQR